MSERQSSESAPSQISYSILQESKVGWQRSWLPIWREYAANTTLHGPNHITSTSKYWRLYYIIIIFVMSFLFIGHSSFLIYQYLQFPINTDVKFQNLHYSYPDVTLCPNSATSRFLLGQSKQAETLYNSTHSFWQSKTVRRESAAKLTKRSFLNHFYRYSDAIGRLPHHHILWCQINDQSCLGQLIVTEHPTYYRCFTLRPRPRPNSILPGPTHGITLLLHRGDPSPPMLQVNEQYSFEMQSSVDNSSLQSHSGFLIGFHEQGSFPNFQLTALPAAIAAKFGDRIRVSLDLTSLKAANLRIRPCQMTDSVPAIELVKSDRISASNADANSAVLSFSYMRQSCIAMKRQELIFGRCGCFSEEYSIPQRMASHGAVWCFDVEGKTDRIVSIDRTIGCVNRQNLMTENEVLYQYVVGGGSRRTLLQTFAVCPLRCDRFIHLIHSIFADRVPRDIPLADFSNYFEQLALHGLTNAFLNASSVVSPDDVIVLDISAVSENVNEVVETRAFNFMSLLSQVGGVSGLYVGVTLFTVFEVMDLMCVWFGSLLPVCYRWCHWRVMLMKERSFQ